MSKFLVVLIILMVGCAKQPKGFFDAEKYPEIRSIALSGWADVAGSQSYTERGFPYAVRAADGIEDEAGKFRRNLVRTGGGLPATGWISFTALAAEQNARKATEAARTERFNERVATKVEEVDRKFRAQLAGELRSSGYRISESSQARTNAAGESTVLAFPEPMSAVDADVVAKSAGQADAVLFVEVTGVGLIKDEQGTEPSFYWPFVAVSTRLQRASDGKLLHQIDYVGIPGSPLSKRGDFDPILDLGGEIRAGYDGAMTHLAKLIALDLQLAP
ncbi:MAG: hypothetical protein AAF743_10495 [Planctomycetota bacterium]